MARMMPRWAVVAGLLLVLVLSACAAPGTPAPAPAPQRPAATAPPAPAPEKTREQKLIEAAKANGEKEVVLWTMHWYDNPGPVGQAFEAKYPFLKLKVWVQTVQVEPRVMEEYKAGTHTPDIIMLTTDRLTRMRLGGDIFAETEWPNVVGWTNQPSHNFWKSPTGALFMPIYNTKLVAPADVPAKWEDLVNAKWRGKAIVSTSGENYPLDYAYLLGDVSEKGAVNWDRSVKFWKELVEAVKPATAPAYQGPTERVGMGDYSILLAGTNNSGLNFRAKGMPVEFAPFKKVFMTTWGLGFAKYPPNPNAARLLLDFLTSEEGALVYANAMLNPTFQPQAAKRANVNRYFNGIGTQWVTIPEGLVSDADRLKSADLWLKDILGVKR